MFTAYTIPIPRHQPRQNLLYLVNKVVRQDTRLAGLAILVNSEHELRTWGFNRGGKLLLFLCQPLDVEAVPALRFGDLADPGRLDSEG